LQSLDKIILVEKNYQGELQTMSGEIVNFKEGAIKNELKELIKTVYKKHSTDYLTRRLSN